LVILINEFRVALMPPRRRVVPPRRCGVLLILRGDSETECLLVEVVDDGLDDDDPFLFLVKRLAVFFHDCSALPHKYIPGVFTR
jgi:hypothetical protein